MPDAVPTSKSDARSSLLLDVAAKLYLERGYEGLSLDEIIEQAGGSQRNVHETYGGREGIFIASISRLCRELITPLEELINPDDPPESNFMRLGNHISDLSLNTKTLALHKLMIAEAVRFPELSQTIYHTGRGRGIEAVEKIIEQNRHRLNDSFKETSSLSLAEMFFCIVINETEVQALIGLDRRERRTGKNNNMVINAVTLFINGLFKKG